jgi:hypothetical protein
MTALHQYSRLEAAGLWRSAPSAQRREVIIGLREATIVLLDPKTDLPLAQWSLPAIVRTGEYEGFVIYASHEDMEETLEIDDPAMIAALDKVRSALDRRRKKPGRLRMALLASACAALGGIVAIWMPMRLYDFVAYRLPDAARAEIAALALADIASVSGSPCTGRLGEQASRDLARRLSPDPPFGILVVPEGITQPATLGDGTVVLPYSLVEAVDGPDSLAGLVLAQQARMAQTDPILPVLHHAGLLATLRLMSSGALPDGALKGYGLALIAAEGQAAQDSGAIVADLAARFAAAKIKMAPYGSYANLPELAALPDPFAQGSEPPVLDDAAFLGMQYICDG